MAIDAINYAQYQSEHTAINTCMSNIEEELNIADRKFEEAIRDGSGTWAETDMADWRQIYAGVHARFNRMQDLMNATGTAVQTTADTEQQVAGLEPTEL